MKAETDLKVKLLFGAPPILPDVQKQLQGYLLNPDELPIHDYEASQQHWPYHSKPSALYNHYLSAADTTLKINRNLKTGEVVDYSEVQVKGERREEWSPKKIKFDEIVDILENVDDEFDLIKDLNAVPPTFSRGFDFYSNANDKAKDSVSKSDSKVVNLVNLLKADQEILNLSDDYSEPTENEETTKKVANDKTPMCQVEDSEFINNISKEVSFQAPTISLSKVVPLKNANATEWAEVIDISHPVTDFHERIPDMAFKYDFELDTFQKQAILKLEENCSVLVSAHTSAGKTAVAEYAIALSQRHMTRAIYTSPIKALSNQKYRDFRKTFQDVGLVTGDFQVNPSGCCLIVTTEILRSMLLAQDEIILDLEFVIFDEVHYINNSDRGHVWEEVLILLPQSVTIVMLSATIPNTLQFADWVGRTKQKKIYVIYTTQRPVPLEHYLYTVSTGSGKDEKFLILSGNKEFHKKGYLDAMEAQKRADAKAKGSGKARKIMGRKQETTMWLSLLKHLQKNDKLPVVAFTLSRKRCDQNAESLASTDLLTAKEKSHVHHFFHRSIQRLKESDQKLPQIRQMQILLECGIGVHHSGILPILKEIVEILFQDRCVKILFATETFAMGVNMPAKTVVFDSITKYDNTERRTLLPSEYIQMAGRAGRRGLDETGTVIIICKGSIPAEVELMTMMLGSPKTIESQFRLTYSIILKLERKRVAAEGRITVEEMMSHSFKEADHNKMKKIYSRRLGLVEKELSAVRKAIQRCDAWEDWCEMCRCYVEYLDAWRDMSRRVHGDKRGHGRLAPGRVVLITHKSHVNKLAIVLSRENKKDAKFRVLALDDATQRRQEQEEAAAAAAEGGKKGKEEEEEEEEVELARFGAGEGGGGGDDDDDDADDMWHKVLGVARKRQIFVPQSVGDHVVLTIDPWDVMEVTTLTIKTDPKIILGDWDNRQIPRFRDKAPGQTCQRAVEELFEVTRNASRGDPELEFVSLFRGISLASDDELTLVNDLNRLRAQIDSFAASASDDSVVNYEAQLRQIFRMKMLEKRRDNLRYMISYKSMSLYPEYQNRLQVLRKLKYIDGNNSVQMKGNVACEMHKNELLITELVLRNALNNLQPAEIAALLSCFVYQGKKENEHLEVTANLQAGIKMIQEIANEVFETERECGVCQSEASGNEDNLNFELVPVVYEWARDKEFSQIMTLTDVQEGIIVRCILQLSEIIREVKDAARIIGEPTLRQKMDDACNAIKRDIVFTTSLYME